jgi:sn-glycerol 3-phosphate transport system substrate-binding protein
MIKRIVSALFLLVCISVTTVWASGTAEQATGPVYLRMYYPVGVAGPLAQLMDSMVADFNNSQKNIQVESIFAGGYKEAMDKSQTAFLSGSPPDLAVLDAPNLLTLLDINAIVPLNQYIKQEGGDAYLATFIQPFLKIGESNGELWSIPWQRSTPVLYYNKDFFSQAGLDPNKPPATWAELESDAQKLTVKDSKGNTTRWGVMIPNDYWIFKPLLLEAGGTGDNDAGNKIVIDDKYNRLVYEWLNHLAQIGVTPGIARWSQSVTDFASGGTAMLYNSTGALTYIRNNTKFNFGTAFLPKRDRQVAIEGGGNFFIFKTTPRHEAAAWEFIKWMTRPENTAKWSLGSGYIPVKKAAFDVPEYKKYTDQWPQALTAYRQLTQTDVERNMMTHRMNEIYDLLNATNEAIRSGGNMDAELKKAQDQANQILSKWQ